MANTSKNTSKKTTKTDDVIIDKEKEELKNKLEELEKKFAELLAKQGAQVVETPAQPKVKKNIKIINLTRGEMYLRGSRIHKFDKQFDSRVFTESEVRQIYANMPKTLTDGWVYIADKEMVEELELVDAYSTLLDEKTLKMLLEKNPKEVIEIYKNANDFQKNIIVGMIEDAKMHGRYVDANIVIEIGKLCGKELMDIEPLKE